MGIYLGHSPFHADNVALVFNLQTGHVSPQYHVIFDEQFTTVEYLRNGETPPNWRELFTHCSEQSTEEDYDLASSWCKYETDLPCYENPDLVPDVDPIIRLAIKQVTFEEDVPTNRVPTAISVEGIEKKVPPPAIFPALERVKKAAVRRSPRNHKRIKYGLMALMTMAS